MNVLTGPMCIQLWGSPRECEQKYLEMWDVPTELEIGVIPKRLYCHKEIVLPLTNAFQNLIKANLVDELKTFDGCYNFRPIRGYETRYQSLMEQHNLAKASELLSIHSWAIAVDVNAAWNRLGKKPMLTNAFVGCFKRAGFDWGGDWQRLDGMHFQLSIDYLKKTHNL